MKNSTLILRFFMGAVAFFTTISLYAEKTQPKFDIIPLTPTTWAIPTNGNATIQYCVTNRTKITRTLTMAPIAGISQTLGVVGGGSCSTPCGTTFTLAQNQSCLLTLQIDGSHYSGTTTRGPVICKTNGPGNNTPDPFLCSQPSEPNSLNLTGVGFEEAMLTVATPPLLLTANPTRNLACEFPGVLTVTNNSKTVTALNITTTPSPPWGEGGTILSLNGCSNLEPGASTCTLTFTPGTSGAISTFLIKGNNTTTTSAFVHISGGIAPISLDLVHMTLDASGPSQSLIITNNSTCIPATNVKADLEGLLTEGGVNQSPIPCAADIAPHTTCTLSISPGGVVVDPTAATVHGDNTTGPEVIISVVSVPAQIEVIGSPLNLTPSGASGTLTIKNVSSITANGVTADLTGPLATAGVTQTPLLGCAPILPNHSCTLTYNPGSTYVTSTQFPIQGSNTNEVSAVISVSPAILEISSNSVVLAMDTSFQPSTGTTPAVSSISRTLTITNTSSFPASNVTYTYSSLPVGTTITPSDCGTIGVFPNNTCVLQIKPGINPSSAAGLKPTPSTISISGINTNTVLSAITVLTYGNKYQGGYVFSMDDSPAADLNIGGKVSSFAPVYQGIAWDPTSQCSDGKCAPIPGASPVNGAANTTSIINTLSAAPYNALPNTYAASVCDQYVAASFNDWYLPASCEMGFEPSTSVGYQVCVSNSYPIIQNIINVVNVIPTYPENTKAYYWCSDQNSTNFGNLIVYGTPPGYVATNKSSNLPIVLCARIF